MAQEIASFYANISANTDNFKKGLGETKDGMSSLEKTSATLGKALTGIFAVATAAAVGFAAVIGKTVSAAAEFEQGITDIGAVMNLTGQETQELQDHIMKLGLSPDLKVSATEASAAIESLGTAGLSLDQIMGGASEATIQLSNATGGDMADSASLITDIMSQFNITAEEAGHIVDQVTGLTVGSKFAFEDAALAISQAGGVAGSTGMSFEDFNSILGVTAANFSSGSDAGTSLKTFLTTLIPKSNEAADVMASLGLVTTDWTRAASDLSGVLGTAVEPSVQSVYEAFKKTAIGAKMAEEGDTALAKAFNGLRAQYSENQFFDDTTHEMKSAADIAGILQGAFGGLGEEQRLEAASTIFGNDAMRTAFGLIDAGTPGITAMAGEIAKVDAGSIASKRMDTFAGAIEIAQGVIETLSISIGQEFLPVLRPLVERFTELATTHGPQIIAFFGKLANGIAAVISPLYDMTFGSGKLWDNLKAVWEVVVNVSAAIGAAVKPIVDLVAKFVSWKDVAMAAGVVLGGVLLVALGAAAVAIGSLIATIAPFIAAFVAIVAVVALVRNAWEHNFMDIQGITGRVWASITGVIGTALDSIAGWLKINTGVWKGDWGKTLDFFLHHSQEAWSNLYDSVVGYVMRMVNETRHVISVWVDQLEYYIRYYVVNTKMHLEVWAGWVKRYFNEAVDWAIDGLKYLFSWFKPREWYEKGVDIIEGLWDGAKKAWQSFTDWWSGIWRRLTGTVDVKMKIGSPSKVMEEKGMFIGRGLALGMQKSLPMIDDALGDMSMSAAGGNYGSTGASGSTGGAATSTSRIEELLTILIQELRAKNMTVNVSGGGGGGGSYGDLVSMRSTLRQGA